MVHTIVIEKTHSFSVIQIKLLFFLTKHEHVSSFAQIKHSRNGTWYILLLSDRTSWLYLLIINPFSLPSRSSESTWPAGLPDDPGPHAPRVYHASPTIVAVRPVPPSRPHIPPPPPTCRAAPRSRAALVTSSLSSFPAAAPPPPPI